MKHDSYGQSGTCVQQSAVHRSKIKPLLRKQLALKKSKLQIGMKLYGIVNRIELFGAFVDIGFEKEALLHISQLNEPTVRNVEDLLRPGDIVSTTVVRINHLGDRVALSLSAPPARPPNAANKRTDNLRAKKKTARGKRKRKRRLRYPYAYADRKSPKKSKKKVPARKPNMGFSKSQTKSTPKKIVMPIMNFAGFSNSSNDWDDLAWKNRFGKRKRKIGF